ncbi:Extradiol aromatic ring-opening dioxygenase [Coniochaeta ligniaria NRRL 30616]|uniref:Extradiol aromatic ring-opening dioxygenase n=1 Tax=Coniochaeta ligniaria NRRL 30616 TaxID=1408157 RepID=A0A1J7IPF4_9PEZI|nr:Extradiol aromatic ring-opening dioxygenase [Coniochaeta ligniaria NRRL 30616]
MPRAAAIAVSHGGGPMPVLGDPSHKDIVSSLRNRVPKILKLGTPDAPRAIVVVTAHWSENRPTISSGKKHPLLYDYGGFPAAAYRLKYDAPGSPEVAEQVRQAFTEAGLSPVMDDERGWDHGVFVPFLLINPAADIPVVQLSVLQSEDAEAHLRMGRALGALRDSNVAIVGSGFASFHNMAAMRHLMMSGSPGAVRARNEAWNAALTAAVGETDAAEREARLSKWRELPYSYDMHPRYGAEHFLPLLVVAGAALEGDGKAKAYKDEFLGVDIWTYYWGDVEV